MKLMIDTAISLLLNIAEHRGEYIPIYEEYVEAIKIGVETMHKYRKIQEIYLKWNRNYGIETSSAWTEVMEVLENGEVE